MKPKNINRLTLAILFYLSFNNTIFSHLNQIQEAEEKEVILQEIEVKQGQTLADISNYYLKDPKLWPELLKYNKLTTNDIYAPLPGAKLKVPIVLVKEKFRPAYLIYMLNKVKYRKNNTNDWKDPTISMELYNDDSINTYEKSKANIKFYSGEVLLIDENSLVTIRPELKQEEINLFRGSVRASKAKIITDSATIMPKIDKKFEKTDYKTKIKEDKTTLVEVYEGAVDVSAQGKTIYVPKGYGTEVKYLSVPSEPKKLPPPPEISLKNTDIKLNNNDILLNSINQNLKLVISQPKQVEDISTKTTKTQDEKTKTIGEIIKKHHIQIAKDIEFKKIIYDEISDFKNNYELNLNIKNLNLQDGKYYYRISYVDELGFESNPVVKSFLVDTQPPIISIKNSSYTKTDNEIFLIEGKTEPSTKLKINDKNTNIEENGQFSTVVLLKQGLNRIEITAVDKNDNETKLFIEAELVKKLTQEEKDALSKKEVAKNVNPGNILATLITIGVIIGVLFFFIK